MEPQNLVPLLRGVGMLALVGFGLYVWVLKVDNRSHENATALSAGLQEVATFAEKIDQIREENRREFEELRNLLQDLRLNQAVILSDQQETRADVKLLTASHQDHVATGAHASAEERLKAILRRLEVDDDARSEMSERLLDLERSRSPLKVAPQY